MRTRRESKSKPQRERKPLPEREYEIAVPNDPVNEQVVLAAMLADDETADRLLRSAPVDAFYADEHRAVREAIAEARRRKLTLDPSTLTRLYPDVDQRLVEKLRASRPEVPENLDYHVDVLLWDRQRAQVAQGPFGALAEALQDPKEDRDRLRSLARQVADAFDQDVGQGKYLLDPKAVVQATMNELRRRTQGEAYYPYGIQGLDYYEDGRRRIRPGAAPDVSTLITALSGSGKSTLMAHLALGIGRQRRRVLFGAWEEEAPVTLELLATLNLGWSRSRVLDGKSNEVRTEGGDDWAPMTRADLVTFEEECHKISKWIYFFKNPFQLRDRTSTGRRVTNDDHLDIIEDHIERSGCEVFFADLLHRSFVDDSPSDERQALFRMVSIQQTTKTHGIWAHQQRSKDVETSADKKPTRAGIIGAGAWLDTPRVVLAPHLPAKWKNVPDDTMEIYVLKQSKGPWPIGIEFDWDPDTGQISNGRSFNVREAPADSSDGAFGIAPIGKGKPKPKGRANKAFSGGRRRVYDRP